MRPPSDSILAPAPRTGPISIAGRAPVPVTLLTGFLGAGKTALLNRILNGDHGLRIGVLINDFGAINIDAELVDTIEENTIGLTNGCVCCEIRDDLVRSLEDLLMREQAVDYVLLEASGVSDPASIVMTFLDKRYAKLLRLDSVTCIVDAEAIFTHGDNADLNTLKMRQIAFADMVILNKVDLVGNDHIDVIHEWIGGYLNRIRIVPAQHCDVPLEVLLAVGRFDPVHVAGQAAMQADISASQEGHSHPHQHGGRMLETWSYENERPFCLGTLRDMVRRELPASIYRCKGIVQVAEAPESKYALQAVGRRTELTELGQWGTAPPHSRIVAIGSGIDTEELASLFDGCLAKDALCQFTD